LDGSRRDSEIQSAESDIQELEQLVKSMNLSARNGMSQSSLAKIKGYENDLSKTKSSLRKATMQMKMTADRDNLFSGGLREEHLSTSMDQRERLLSQTERLERTKTDLNSAIQTANQTVEVGIEVMANLDEQKGKMTGILGRLGHVNENLGRAKKIMTTMGRRVVTNKLIMAMIILVLLLAICLIIYFKFFSTTSTTPTTSPVDSSSTSIPFTSGT